MNLSEADGGRPLGRPLPGTMPPREAGEPPTRGLAPEVLLVVGDHRPGEVVSGKHETRVRR